MMTVMFVRRILAVLIRINIDAFYTIILEIVRYILKLSFRWIIKKIRRSREIIYFSSRLHRLHDPVPAVCLIRSFLKT